ncbi:hypothetical protein GOBAR_AA20669 [Gossypium barbadense]|uniref:VQ domain-containing protein n=1 Tax=Gossypium barbadense TaxID=3634 RepID=A0A2P5X9J3_GOSBA|nr:hypothetical protein GOBAR_AA20669 [Gossypium barbadense]
MEANKGPLKCVVCCHCHAKKESTSNIGNGGSCPPPPRRSSLSSSSIIPSLGLNGTSKPQQQRHPVIIYMHSPKVIHTHSKDFIALVQKLTRLSYNKDDHQNHNNHVFHQPKAESGAASEKEDNKRINNVESLCNF